MHSLNNRPCVIFLTGLPAAGKTTIAKALQREMTAAGLIPVLLDGDEIRNATGRTGFDEESRKLHNLETGRLAALFESQGHLVIVALVAPYEETRNEIRQQCRRFFEVYVATDIKVCMARDPKGLYEKAARGEIRDFTGISAPYYPPASPELILDAGQLTVEECRDAIIAMIKK